ncbi:family 16 glycosylhydrolase [Actinoplanes sp. NPDC026623]|uniref:family 16 glycosylhydrolase n=1 Tax=Actinoplanes sp. NPDC026623 TaxID=3155610 RepID=UPI0033D2F382
MPRHSLPQQPTWLRPRLVVAFVVAAAGLTTAIWLPTRNDTADASERNRNSDGFRGDRDRAQSLSTFDDDFDGGRGSTVDPAKWSLNTDRADNGLAFSESTRNARLDGDGNLTIILRRQDGGGFSSARLLSKATLRAASGHAEARIKTPEGDGTRPAFELIGAGRRSFGSFEVLTEPLSDDFHTYAVDWTPDGATLSVDGEQVGEASTESGLGTDQPFRVALSLAVGDDRSGTGFPARMVIDSVSFSAAGATAPPTTAPTTEPPAEPTATPTTAAPTTAPTTEPPTAAPTTAAPTTTAPPTTPPTTAPATKEWAPFTDYVAGQLVVFKGVEYQVLETHTSLPGWEPTALPNLFKKL